MTVPVCAALWSAILLPHDGKVTHRSTKLSGGVIKSTSTYKVTSEATAKLLFPGLKLKIFSKMERSVRLQNNTVADLSFVQVSIY